MVTTETKLAFLLRYTQMKERILLLLERKKVYELDIYGLKSPVLSDMPKGGKSQTIADKVIKMLSVTSDIDNEIEELTNKMQYIRDVIHKQTNYRHVSYLELKYIDGLQRKQIAGILNISLIAVDKCCKRAVEALEITEADIDKIL